MATDLSNWQDATRDQMAFGKNAYLEAIPDLSYSMGASRAIGGLQSRAAMDQMMLSGNLAKRRGQFDGMEDAYSKTAMETNSAGNQQRVANEASAGVAQQFGNLKQQGDRSMARMGVNPSSGRAAAMSNQMAIAQAAATVGAQSKARNDLDVLADSRQRTAIGFGSPLVAQSMSATQNANAIGNSAIKSANNPLESRLNFAGGISNMYGNAANGYKDLWQSQNLTASQQANLNSSNADRDSGEQNAFIGAIGSITGKLASTKAGEEFLTGLIS